MVITGNGRCLCEGYGGISKCSCNSGFKGDDCSCPVSTVKCRANNGTGVRAHCVLWVYISHQCLSFVHFRSLLLLYRKI